MPDGAERDDEDDGEGNQRKKVFARATNRIHLSEGIREWGVRSINELKN
jgi:hypothetical protein